MHPNCCHQLVVVVSILLLCCSALLCQSQGTCDGFTNVRRIDCHPELGATQSRCESRGCCWRAPSRQAYRNNINLPYCYYPQGYNAYYVQSVVPTPNGYTAYLEKNNTLKQWPKDVLRLKVITEKYGSHVHVKYVDLNKTRWEPPVPIHWPPHQQYKSHKEVHSNVNLFVPTVGQLFQGIQFQTADNGTNLNLFADTMDDVVFPLIYTDQFIQATVALADFTHIYGLGEQRRPFLHNASRDWLSMAFYTRDQPPIPNINLYGVHNFFVGISPKTGAAMGMFMLNSNAQEVIIQPFPLLTYRVIGGILDTYIITGDSPMDVVSQYWSLLGSPVLPPYWSLGFHLCRWGYKDVNDVKAVVDRNRKALIPHDVQWTDIDYMNKYLDWTLDPVKFGTLGNLVKQLQSEYGMHYVPIVDPGISNTQPPGSYPPYDKGLAQGLFVRKQGSNSPLVGSVWPGTTVYPDFSDPGIVDWWYETGIQSFHNQVPFDGLWIDMNEPSSFVDGSNEGCPKNNTFDWPPYTPSVYGNSLQAKTICPSGETSIGPMYDVHNLYGYLEAKVTNVGLQKLLPNKRVFLLTRSSFAGSGVVTFHWTGDNGATWDDLADSVIQIMNFNLFGIPMVGADICGFMGNTNEELCTRWMQLGSFYPFMRNHNALGSTEQDPAVWSPIAQSRIRESLRLRYSLLVYLYYHLFRASQANEMVFRPLWIDFPKDTTALGVENQFMFGNGIMVAPVLNKSTTTQEVYFPASTWCNLHNMSSFVITTPSRQTVPVSMDNIPIFIRGGAIIPFQGLNFNVNNKTFFHEDVSATLTSQYRKLHLNLFACASSNGDAEGKLVWDDGLSADTLEKGTFSQFSYTLQGYSHFEWTVDQAKYWSEPLQVGSLHVFALSACPRSVTVNSKNWTDFTCHSNSILSVSKLDQLIWIDRNVIEWKF